MRSFIILIISLLFLYCVGLASYALVTVFGPLAAFGTVGTATTCLVMLNALTTKENTSC